MKSGKPSRLLRLAVRSTESLLSYGNKSLQSFITVYLYEKSIKLSWDSKVAQWITLIVGKEGRREGGKEGASGGTLVPRYCINNGDMC